MIENLKKKLQIKFKYEGNKNTVVLLSTLNAALHWLSCFSSGTLYPEGWNVHRIADFCLCFHFVLEICSFVVGTCKFIRIWSVAEYAETAAPIDVNNGHRKGDADQNACNRSNRDILQMKPNKSNSELLCVVRCERFGQASEYRPIYCHANCIYIRDVRRYLPFLRALHFVSISIGIKCFQSRRKYWFWRQIGEPSNQQNHRNRHVLPFHDSCRPHVVKPVRDTLGAHEWKLMSEDTRWW